MVSTFKLFNTRGEVLISSQGARILNWRIFDGLDQKITIIQAQEAIDDWFESAVLFPWVNRLENGTTVLNGDSVKLSDYREGLHGLVYDAAFQSIYSTDKEICLQFKGERLPNFPFLFEFLVTYVLTDQGLSVRFRVINRSKLAMPFAVGWHPYFLLSEHSTIQFNSSKSYELNEDLLPTGLYEIKNASKYDFTTEVDDLHFIENQELTINSDSFSLEMSTNNLPYFQLFRDKRHGGFAIEPLSGAGNCLNNKIGLISLDTGKEWKGTVDLSIR